MNLYNLKIFADTARLGSMTKAGELNHLSRPAVSQAIKKLESEIGVELLIHQRRIVELTQAGRLLLKKSEALLTEAENVARAVRQETGPLIRDFRIGSSRTLATFNLPPVLEKLRAEYPEVLLQVQMANSGALVKKLESKEIDLAFLIGDDSLEGSKHVIVGRGHFVLIKPKTIREDLVKYAVTEKRPETDRLRVLYERQFAKTLPVFAEIHSWDAIWHSVNEGFPPG
ncbi:MAG: LysR family transcriptional regulator, partial [Proteobacteria bacterium]